MTSLELFNMDKIVHKPAVDWGTGELQSDKFDPTYIKAPTFLLKNQPIKQMYRENNLELSNVRMNDQLMPKPFKINILEKQIQHPFPMQHPYTSHMSYNALFPNFTAPEDAKRGEAMLKSQSNIYDLQTPSKVDDTIIVKKTHGFPWRQEVQQLQLPTQRRGVWFEDKQYYHVPKPDDQLFYLHPQNILVPNPKLRPDERSIDQLTANVLRNKEKQLMQSTNQADFYKDGLGTQAPINSDDLIEKKIRYEATGQINDHMKPYFKRGGGISHATLEPAHLNVKSLPVNQEDHQYSNNFNKPKLLTDFEFDEKLMETGKDYVNLPNNYYPNNPLVQSLSSMSLSRSNTMPNLLKIDSNDSRSKSAILLKNKLDAEKHKIDQENHDRIQKIQMDNRRHEIDLITPDRDIRLLRIKQNELENAQGAKPNQKQNTKHHVETFYNQEAKYFGERAQLYRTPVYNPYLVKQYIESVKADPKISSNYTSGSANAAQANFQMPNDSYEHRPKLFAHKVFGDYELLKRAPLEQVLIDPSISASVNTQENGITQQQTTMGGSYNTKKFLQEYEQIPSKSTHEYFALDPAELQHQNITLKSQADKMALSNYKNAITNKVDLNTARDMIRINEKKASELEMTQFPRLAGPIPPEPYEAIYCAEQASEMGDGYSKRYYSRVYDSPHANPANQARYEPLRSDLQAMGQYEAKAYKDMQDNQEYLNKLQNDMMKKARANETSHVDRSKEKVSRRVTDHTAVELREHQQPLSTYMANYSPYAMQHTESCPPNEFYKDCDYAETVGMKLSNENTPKNIITLQDKWSKSLANQMYHSKYVTSTPDLRENITKGKKRIMANPQYAYQFA